MRRALKQWAFTAGRLDAAKPWPFRLSDVTQMLLDLRVSSTRQPRLYALLWEEHHRGVRAALYARGTLTAAEVSP
jgi:hypothetical protein